MSVCKGCVKRIIRLSTLPKAEIDTTLRKYPKIIKKVSRICSAIVHGTYRISKKQFLCLSKFEVQMKLVSHPNTSRKHKMRIIQRYGFLEALVHCLTDILHGVHNVYTVSFTELCNRRRYFDTMLGIMGPIAQPCTQTKGHVCPYTHLIR